MQKFFLVLLAAIIIAGCQGAPQFGEPTSDDTVKGAETKKTSSPAPTQKKEAPTKASPTKPKLGPKATAQSYELRDGCKIVSGTVLRIMHFGAFKGTLVADKAPKGIKFVLQGTKVDGYEPKITLSIYDAEKKGWAPLETFTLIGEMTKRYPLKADKPGTYSFLVSYNATTPEGGKARPNIFVKSAELEF